MISSQLWLNCQPSGLTWKVFYTFSYIVTKMAPLKEITDLLKKAKEPVKVVEKRIKQGDVMFSIEADWCKPCKVLRENLQNPEVKNTLKELGVDLYFVDTEDHEEVYKYVSKQTGGTVAGIPNILSFDKAGEYQGNILGIIPTPQVVSKINKWYNYNK